MPPPVMTSERPSPGPFLPWSVPVASSEGDAISTADGLPALREELDGAVVAAFRSGDVEALGQVYDRYSGPVLSVSMTVLGNRALAEEATQETFLRAWRGASAFDGVRPLGPWLLTIARRTAIDVLRRENRPTQGGHEDEQDAMVRMPGIEHSWEAWEIRLALDGLPPDERTVVRMAHFGGMTHSEIAEALAVPVGTVKSRSHRAHRRLADRLSHLMEGGAR